VYEGTGDIYVNYNLNKFDFKSQLKVFGIILIEIKNGNSKAVICGSGADICFRLSPDEERSGFETWRL
jgi:hypothetical protein